MFQKSLIFCYSDWRGWLLSDFGFKHLHQKNWQLPALQKPMSDQFQKLWQKWPRFDSWAFFIRHIFVPRLSAASSSSALPTQPFCPSSLVVMGLQREKSSENVWKLLLFCLSSLTHSEARRYRSGARRWALAEGVRVKSEENFWMCMLWGHTGLMDDFKCMKTFYFKYQINLFQWTFFLSFHSNCEQLDFLHLMSRLHNRTQSRRRMFWIHAGSLAAALPHCCSSSCSLTCTSSVM